jgi:hypothetical protein
VLDPDSTRVVPTHPGAPGSGLDSPHALQILTTEHWSLLSSRSLGYTEAMSRASIYVAALTGSVVALALVGQATGFDDAFLAFALVLLPVVFFLGFVTIARLAQITWEDANWVQGMNRIRHAYLELAPELEPYFVTSKHDDDEGVLITTLAVPRVAPGVQSFIAIPGVIAVLDSVVAGAIAAITAHALDAETAWTLATGVATFAVVLVGFGFVAVRMITALRSSAVVRFPSPS